MMRSALFSPLLMINARTCTALMKSDGETAVGGGGCVVWGRSGRETRGMYF